MNSWLEKSGRTAMHRRGPSAPARMLWNLLERDPSMEVLDYGCGRGADCDAFGWYGWDPVHRDNDNDDSIMNWYDVVVCIYVLNTLPDYIRAEVYEKILALGHEVYVVVRDDIEGKTGPWAKTYQELVNVEAECPELRYRADLSKPGSWKTYTNSARPTRRGKPMHRIPEVLEEQFLGTED